MSILHVPHDTELAKYCIAKTKLAEVAPFESDDIDHTEELKAWIINHNVHDKYALHRACVSYNPLKQVVFRIIEEKGLKAFKEENDIGISPSRYLKENLYAEVSEMEIVRKYISKKLNF